MLEGFEMEKRQLLFVTHRDDNLAEGVSYAIELAKAMDEDIMLLIVQKRSNLIGKLENLMTAVTFAEAGEHDTARQIATEDSRGMEEAYNNELDAVVKKCLYEGIHVRVHTSSLDTISGIRNFLKEHRAIDKVVLSPAITAAGNITSKDMSRLVRTVSRPIVTMTRQACAVAYGKEQRMKVRALVLSLCILIITSPVFGEDKTEFKSQKEKQSYAVGMNMGRNLKDNSIDIDYAVLIKGIKDALSGGKTLLTEQEARETITALQKDLRAKQQLKMKILGESNKKDGEAFLAENKQKDGVKTLPSGLQYNVLTEGKGNSPKGSDTVLVHYRGTLIDGTEFDNSYKRNQPASFPVNGVIKGWTEALQLMKEGSKWRLVVPANLAYGESGRPGIPPNAVLIFEVELIKIGAKEK